MTNRKEYIEANLTEILRDLNNMNYIEFTEKYFRENEVSIFPRWINGEKYDWKKCIRNSIRINLFDENNEISEISYTYLIGKVPQDNKVLTKIENILGIRLEK